MRTSDGFQVSPMPGGCGNWVVGIAANPFFSLPRLTTPWMPSELPKLGMPSRLTLVSVARAAIFSSTVISDRILVIRCAAGGQGRVLEWVVIRTGVGAHQQAGERCRPQ